jgi:CO dehydrogenase nickel-insertion accessory protein CooC1
MDIPLLGLIPYDYVIVKNELAGRPLVELNEDSPTYHSVSSMMQQIL